MSRVDDARIFQGILWDLGMDPGTGMDNGMQNQVWLKPREKEEALRKSKGAKCTPGKSNTQRKRDRSTEEQVSMRR